MSKHMTIRLGGVTVQKHIRDVAKALTRPALFCGTVAVVDALRLEDGQALFTLSTYS